MNDRNKNERSAEIVRLFEGAGEDDPKLFFDYLGGQVDSLLEDEEQVDPIKERLAWLQYICFLASCSGGWWHDIETCEKKERNRGEQLMLVVSEIAEAMEGERKNLMDDHLPHRPMAEVELADAVIRIFDYAEGHGYDLAGALIEKMRYNRQRADHKPENRAKDDGKKF